MNNQVNSQDVTYMSLALTAFGTATAALTAHDYIVAGGMLVVGVIFVYLYHLFGSPSIPQGTLPVTVPNTSGGTLATPTTPTVVTSPVNPTVVVAPTTPPTATTMPPDVTLPTQPS